MKKIQHWEGAVVGIVWQGQVLICACDKGACRALKLQYQHAITYTILHHLQQANTTTQDNA